MGIITTYFIYLTFFSFIFSSLVSSQSDSCASKLNNLNGGIPFETTSLHCNPVWSSEDYILRYLQTRPNIWSFVLSAPNTISYVAIGFSTTGRMVGSSAMVGWVPANGVGVGVVKQYFLGATNPAQVVPDQGNLQLVANSTAIVSQSSRLYIAFQLNVTQPESRLLYSVGPRNRIPSSDNRLVQHREHISTRLDYTSGQLTTERPYTTLRRIHGILNMIGWGIILIIGVMAARYLKQWDPIWFYSHSSIQLLGFIMGVSGVILGFVVENSLNASVDRHKTIGMFILILGCLQVIAFLVRPGKEAKVRKYWNWYHYIVGRIVIVLAVINIFYGIHVGDEGNGWKIGYGVTLAILGIVGVGLEVRKLTRKT